MPNFEMVREDPNEKRNAKIRAKLRLLFVFVIFIIGVISLILRDSYVDTQERAAQAENEAKILKKSTETKAAICAKLIDKNYLNDTLVNCQRDKFSLRNGFDKFITDVEVDLREKINIKLKILNNQTFLDLAKAETITFREAYERGHTSFFVNLTDKATETEYYQLFEIQDVEFTTGFFGISVNDIIKKVTDEVQGMPLNPIDNENTSLGFMFQFNYDDSGGNVFEKIDERLEGRFNTELAKMEEPSEESFVLSYFGATFSIRQLCEIGCIGDVHYTVQNDIIPTLVLQHITVKPISLLAVKRVIKELISYDELADENLARESFDLDRILDVLDF